MAQVDIDQRHQHVQHLLAQVADELHQLEQEVGSLKTLATVTEPRTKSRGFEPVRSLAHRTETPEAHLAELRSDASELHQLGVELRDSTSKTTAEPEQPKVAA